MDHLSGDLDMDSLPRETLTTKGLWLHLLAWMRSHPRSVALHKGHVRFLSRHTELVILLMKRTLQQGFKMTTVDKWPLTTGVMFIPWKVRSGPVKLDLSAL